MILKTITRKFYIHLNKNCISSEQKFYIQQNKNLYPQEQEFCIHKNKNFITTRIKILYSSVQKILYTKTSKKFSLFWEYQILSFLWI